MSFTFYMEAGSTWLEYAWDEATWEWFKNLTSEERRQVWMGSLEQANSFSEGTYGDIRLHPTEEFLVKLLNLLADRSGKGPEAGAGGEDPLLEALATANKDEADLLLSAAGTFRGVQFDHDRAQKLLTRYIIPYLDGSRFDDNDLALGDALGAPSFPEEVVRQAVEAMVKPVESKKLPYVKYGRLGVWNAYLSRADNPTFLAECADLFFKELKAVPNRNQDQNMFVELLASTTTHHLFPSSWVENHYLEGNQSYPIATAADSTAFKARYPKSASTSVVLPETRQHLQANRAVDLGAFMLWTVPDRFSDERAFDKARRCTSSSKNRLGSCALPVMGYYFHVIEQAKKEMGVEDVPDEWILELLT